MNKNNSIQFHWRQFVFSFSVLSLILSSCAKPTAQIALVEPVIEKTKFEKFDLKNCDQALEDLHAPVTEYFNVKQEVTIADQATAASGASSALSTSEKENLAEQVMAAYQAEYDAAQAVLAGQEFEVPMDRAANFDISWNSQVYSSTLDFEANGAAHTVAYQYTLTIPEIGERTIAICGG